MKKSTIASLISLAFTSPAFAAENINLDDVVVTASRVSQSRDSVLGDVTVINQEEIERAGAGSITDLLQSQPGVQINTSGGAGKASNIFLRGTNADHLIVLVDGLRINSATLGTTSFENIPLSQIEKIEILRGPASSLYGADAIGGVIQIFTKKGEAGKPLIHAAAGFGSYNTKTAEAGFSAGAENTRYGININSFATAGFSAQRILATNTPIDKDNDGYRNLGIAAYIDHTFAPGHSLGLQYFASKGHSSFDGNNFDDFGNETLQSYALTSSNQFTDAWLSTLKLGKGIDDSDSHSNTGISLFKTDQLQYTWQNDIKLPVGTLTLAYDRLEQKVSGSTNYTVKARDNNGYLASYLAEIGKHAFQFSLRNDENSQYGGHTTGGIGYGYRITPEWRIATNYGTAFKAPTFNQLYYPGFGNANLIPEQSKNVEASVKYATDSRHAGITIFDNKISNLIAFSGPATAGCTLSGFCPVNVGQVEIVGATFDGGWNISDNLTLNGNLTIQSPRDDKTEMLLIRRGNRYGALSLLHAIGNFQWGAEVTGASVRYNNATNTKRMGGYTLLNLTANYRINPEWKLEARANNVLDKDYVLSYTGNSATSNPYNTAGANVFVGLRYQMQP
ncbi:vitamin B12 transporter BtuB precursor [mine drainage metagenome]|uniref:Vitamin B12 transporter BtuB n=1 Tax=mine drainage metagenome TaxID=410659 RepID=A0A1J5R6R7_9ZZZZ